jgi:predicted O-linked N-acetylglucosamine transferase (SPINDLY family)
VRALATNLIAREACDWDFAARLEPAARQLLERPDGIAASSPWLLLALQRLSAEEQLTLTQSFVAAAYGDTPPRRPALVSPRARIRLGYLSADFYNHPTSVLLAGVIENHDRSRFELLACDLSPPVRDHYRLRLEAAFDKFVSLRELGDTEASAAIAREEIDIIIDLNGWTLGGRPGLLAPRPAAVQMQWLGYAGTLGAPWIDYIVADATVVPPGDDRFYTEKVIRLPETYQPNDRPEPPGRVPARAELGLPEQGMVLCCFNQMFKITAEVFALWMRILRRTPDAVLWLLAPGDGVQERLRQAARRHGVAPERLIFAPKVERDAHMARLKLVDLALDCLPYGSHTTAADAIRAGVPLIALQGETFAARVSASIVRAAGLPELIASDPQTYEDLVCRILADPVARSALRGRVTAARQTSILFDPARFARQLEQALGAAYERARSGLPPEAIDLRTAGG